MKSKLKLLPVLVLLIVCMSSCVYSLFPIFTEDTLVYLPELEGKWMTDGDPDDYIMFEVIPLSEGSLFIDSSEDRPSDEPRVKMEWSSTQDHKEYIVVDGDTIRDKTLVGAYTAAQMDSMNASVKDVAKNLISNGANRADEKGLKYYDYNRSTKSYNLTFVENGKKQAVYVVHVVDIDDQLFLDLYPAEDHIETGMSWNLFPVHSFMKIELSKNKLNMIQFDLEKLNKLFESNLIRMRHENVDGTILITAQPEELQKFLSKYSDDESVFDETTAYKRELSK